MCDVRSNLFSSSCMCGTVISFCRSPYITVRVAQSMLILFCIIITFIITSCIYSFEEHEIYAGAVHIFAPVIQLS